MMTSIQASSKESNWTMPLFIQPAYNAVCNAAEWLDTQCITLTEKTFHGNFEAAAISRVALKTLATLSLYLVSPFPTIVTFTVLSLGQLLLNRGNWEKPWYVTTACLTNLFLQSITLSHPMIEMVTPRGSTFSIILHGLSALGMGFELIQHIGEQCLEELKSSYRSMAKAPAPTTM